MRRFLDPLDLGPHVQTWHALQQTQRTNQVSCLARLDFHTAQMLTNIRRILKISALIPIYSIISWITIAAPNSYIYLDPWLDFFQSIALGSFFLLLCEFVSPSAQHRDVFFAALEVPKSRRGGGKQVDGLEWYRKKWFAVFQYPIVALLVSIVTDITQAASVYCLESSSIHFAHLWVRLPFFFFQFLPFLRKQTDFFRTDRSRNQHLHLRSRSIGGEVLHRAQEGPETPQAPG
jgi:hypothetical protein